MTTQTEAGTLTLALRTAQSGRLSNQAALNVTANNIANVNNPEYSRKVVNFESRVLASFPSGVQLSEVTRKIDEGLLKSLRLQLSQLQERDVKESFFERTQDLFGKPEDNTSIAHMVTNFTNALEALAVSPDKSLEQNELVRWGRELTLTLQNLSTNIQELRLQADRQIGDNVTLMNNLIANIGDLNDKIVRNSAVNLDVTDLKDQRDTALNQLSEILDIRFFSRGDGDIIVFSSDGRTLVDNVSSTVTHNTAANVAASTTFAEGDFGGIFVGAQITANDITGDLRGGKLKGLVELRDGTLADLQSQIDELAAETRDVFNQIHNRAVPFPGARTLTGTRNLIQPGTSTVTFGGTTDTRIVVLDASANETASTTVRTLLGSNSGTVNAIATAVQTFLQANGAAGATVAVNSTDNLAIALNSTTVSIALRDEATASTRGATAADAVIQFDADADGTTDETVNGFSSFFGLNDFFVDSLTDNIYDSNVLASGFAASAATLSFINSTGTITSTFAVTAGESLQTVATNITNSVGNVVAAVVPEGAGVRLRITTSNGDNLIVTQAAGNTFLTDIGLHSADVRVAGVIEVRSDIVSNPGLVTRGAVQFDSGLGLAGEYQMGVGDDTTVQQLASAFANTNSFDETGGLSSKTASFAQFAAAILGRNSSLADANATEAEFNRDLTNSLRLKSDNVRGVNLDEELANLIVFEQAFSAAARVISVIQNIFDALERVIR